MPIDPRRRDEFAAAVAAYDAAHPEAPLPSNAARLLAAMFPAEDVWRRSQETLLAEGFSRNGVSATLRCLVEIGLLSKQRGSAAIPDTYRLRLPALVPS